MKPENFTERKKDFLKFGLLYAGSIAALIVFVFLLLVGSPKTISPSAVDAPRLSPTAAQKTTDSILQELTLVRNKILEKDSLIASLENRPQPPVDPKATAEKAKGDPADRQLLEILQKENASDHQALTQLQNENAVMQHQLDEKQKNTDALAEQLATLRHSNETLQSRINGSHTAASTDNTAASDHAATYLDRSSNTEARNTVLIAKNAALERQTSELADQLRFAEVDCNISRADARQIVYNARQRKDLLTDALTTLNELAKSEDPEVQKKAREKLMVLRSIAGMVHD